MTFYSYTCSIFSVAVQILFSGDGHWLCSSYSDIHGVCIYDSFPSESLPSEIEIQVARIYGAGEVENRDGGNSHYKTRCTETR